MIVTICVLGQTAIWIKKFFEYYKERQVQNNANVIIQNNQPANNGPINNIHWNHQICNNCGLLVIIFLFLVCILSQYVWRFKWNHWMLVSWKNSTLEEKAHIYDNIEFIFFNVPAIIMYFRNEKLRKHVVDEIKDICA